MFNQSFPCNENVVIYPPKLQFGNIAHETTGFTMLLFVRLGNWAYKSQSACFLWNLDILPQIPRWVSWVNENNARLEQEDMYLFLGANYSSNGAILRVLETREMHYIS